MGVSNAGKKGMHPPFWGFPKIAESNDGTSISGHLSRVDISGNVQICHLWTSKSAQLARESLLLGRESLLQNDQKCLKNMEKSRFGTSEVSYGLFAHGGGPHRASECRDS